MQRFLLPLVVALLFVSCDTADPAPDYASALTVTVQPDVVLSGERISVTISNTTRFPIWYDRCVEGYGGTTTAGRRVGGFIVDKCWTIQDLIRIVPGQTYTEALLSSPRIPGTYQFHLRLLDRNQEELPRAVGTSNVVTVTE